MGTDFNTRHLSRSEVWLLTWLEDNGVPYHLFSDSDFHLGTFDPASYAGLVLSTHPEYWTWAMRDNLDRYLSGGGRMLYLGGNGLYERLEFSAATPNLMLVRQGVPRPGSPDPLRWLFRCEDNARPEMPVLGVAYDGGTHGRKVGPYKVKTEGHPFFGGSVAHNKAIGVHGLTGTSGTAKDGEACGWEMDTSVVGPGHHEDPGKDANGCKCVPQDTPPGHVVLAESDDQACQLTYYPTGTGATTGFVLSAGSLTFTGSLVVDSDLQALVSAALRSCLP
jgi:N,N-dimethylformamidase